MRGFSHSHYKNSTWAYIEQHMQNFTVSLINHIECIERGGCLPSHRQWAYRSHHTSPPLSYSELPLWRYYRKTVLGCVSSSQWTRNLISTLLAIIFIHEKWTMNKGPNVECKKLKIRAMRWHLLSGLTHSLDGIIVNSSQLTVPSKDCNNGTTG